MAERGTDNSAVKDVGVAAKPVADLVLATLQTGVARSQFSPADLATVLGETSSTVRGLNPLLGEDPNVSVVTAFFANENLPSIDITPGALSNLEATAPPMEEISSLAHGFINERAHAANIEGNTFATQQGEQGFEDIVAARLSNADFQRLGAAFNAAKGVIAKGLENRGLPLKVSAVLGATLREDVEALAA